MNGNWNGLTVAAVTVFAVCVTLLPISGWSGVYRWKDANGKWRFSDKPPHQGVAPVESSGSSGLSVIEQKVPEVAGFKRRYNASRNGHFFITAKIKGETVEFMADTGASLVVLNKSTAQKIGISLNTLKFTQRSNTANGQVSMAPIKLDITIGSLRMRQVSAAVNSGVLKDNLLGMSFFNRLKRFHTEKGVLTIEWDAGQTR